MTDLTHPRWMLCKAILLVVAGLLAVALILHETPELKVAALIAIAVWAFARAYYFAFYVIEKYIDPTYRFAGLGSALVFLWRRGLKPPTR